MSNTPPPADPATQPPADAAATPPPAPEPPPAPPAPARPKPAPKDAKISPPKVMSLRGFLRAAGIISIISILIGFTLGWWAAPEKTGAPASLSEVHSEIASLKLAMESGQSSATKVAELEKKLGEAEAAQKAAEARAEEAVSHLKKMGALDEESMKALREITDIPADKTLYLGPAQ